jgi:hypothetical protein
MRGILLLAVAGVALGAVPAARAQSGAAFAPDQWHPVRERALSDRYPDKPSLPPAFSIPVEPLGFSAPGPIFLGERNSMASLDFIDENRLLFTFRVPGLIRRQLQAGESAESDERRIRAVVLTLPAGRVEVEALWTVHDRVRYLWMLKDGHFLLRDRDGLQQGDATLVLKPFLHFPGPLVWMELDPTQQFLVTNSLEPATAVNKPGDVSSPATAAASVTADGQTPANPEKPDLVVRILHRATGQVMLVSRVRSSVHIPLNADGYLESLRGNGDQWALNLNYFAGGSTILGRIASVCAPAIDFVSQREVLATTCASTGGHKLVAMTTGGRTLWEDLAPATAIWPLVTTAPNGLRLARETLAISHPVSASSPIDREDIKGQLVRIFDAATGEVALESPASPALDAGGNVAISPSGRRVAVLNAGAIQVFELPAPPPLPDAGTLPAR